MLGYTGVESAVGLNQTTWKYNEHVESYDRGALVMGFSWMVRGFLLGGRARLSYSGLHSDEVCPCGLGLSLMRLIEGRSDSFIQTPDGRTFSPIIWTLIMRQISDVGQFKAIQERKDLVRILVVRDPAFTEATVGQIVHDVQEVMGEGMHVDVELVEEIPKDKSGKVRCAVSKVVAQV